MILTSFRLLCSLCFLLFISLLAWSRLQAQDQAAAIAPLLDEQTLLVGRVNLRKIDAAAAVKVLGDVAPEKEKIAKQLADMEQHMKATLERLTGAGISELYFVLSFADFPKEPLIIAAPVKSQGDATKAAETLRGVFRLEAADARSNLAIIGSRRALQRIKQQRPTARPEFAKGFERAGDTAAQFVFSPSEDTRRVLREMLPRLPDQVGGGSGKLLSDGVQWAVLSIDAPPQMSVSLTIQSKDADAASALRGTIVSALATVPGTEGTKNIPRLDDVLRLLTPQLKGDQLVISASDQARAQTLLNVLLPAVQAARTSAGRAQSMNNLKQIALAMHNYHDTFNHFPPQAVRGKDGKPLLSWRVALLPYLEANGIYLQFHLDEPWDSEHNKKLIDKMPMSLASPALGDELRLKGMTSYLVPLSKMADAKPQMVFDVVEGTQFSKITDGTSNTILVLEANPKSAVIWTKPDDLVMDESDLLKDLRDQPDNGFCTAFCDGSVRFISRNVDLGLFLRLLQMNDGKPVNEF